MEVIRTSQFKKKQLRLPKAIQRSLAERVLLFLEDQHHPLLHNHPLQGEFFGCRSLNITGDYRLIFEMIDKNIIQLIDIDTHHNLYGS